MNFWVYTVLYNMQNLRIFGIPNFVLRESYVTNCFENNIQYITLYRARSVRWTFVAIKYVVV
jgi:hypothetical protein